MPRPICAMILFAWISAASAGEVQQESSTAAARQAVIAASASALQGNVASSIEILDQVPASAFAGSDAAFRTCMLSRFGPPFDEPPPGTVPDLAARAIGVFRSYWRAALLRPDRREAEEERLRAELVRLLDLAPASDLAEVERVMAERLQHLGLHLLMGRTPPLREFALWSSERRESRTVPLPEGAFSVNVVLLDEFHSLGWSHFATCGRSMSGGWVGTDAIHAIVPGWPDLSSERFLVSFLGHEAQHFSDRQGFGELEAWELEYRAKLAELAMARSSISRLAASFAGNQGDDPAVPHSYANGLVVRALRARLATAGERALHELSAEEISLAARAELAEDTLRRRGVDRASSPVMPEADGAPPATTSRTGAGHAGRPASAPQFRR